ncbi:hypothetical protein [Leptolyngbya sp. 7M]|uniref:hypothetical protein n=1 Tax=Leptolyngbya sp. 7M TaxID=2812896 RepID=UPI001B8C7FA3|nr:hypothetical protein [Leptolyngbya sp. 7M]QYO67099.1 hypothetical protein JVX88_09975 [Leptolyngbya sp. 7M]
MYGASNCYLTEAPLLQEAILVVDRHRRIVGWNYEFVQLWGLATTVFTTLDDQQVLKTVADQFLDSVTFRSEIEGIYAQAELEFHDLVLLREERYFHRHTYPLRLGKLIVGRVWKFYYTNGMEYHARMVI